MQECCGDDSEWNFMETYKKKVMRPFWRWNLGKMVTMQNIILSGGATVKESMLKRQETYGVAFALILGCSIGVLAAIANRQGSGECNPNSPDSPDRMFRQECWFHQYAAGTSIGTSILVLMIVLQNIAYLSAVPPCHIAHTVDKYQPMFALPAALGIPATLIPLTYAVGLSISINMLESDTFGYPPSLTVYVFMFVTFLLMLIQMVAIDYSSVKRIKDEASWHFPMLVFPDLPWGICSSPTMMEADGNGTISPEEWQRAGKNLEDMPLRFQDFEQCPQSAQEANTVSLEVADNRDSAEEERGDDANTKK